MTVSSLKLVCHSQCYNMYWFFMQCLPFLAPCEDDWESDFAPQRRMASVPSVVTYSGHVLCVRSIVSRPWSTFKRELSPCAQYGRVQYGARTVRRIMRGNMRARVTWYRQSSLASVMLVHWGALVWRAEAEVSAAVSPPWRLVAEAETGLASFARGWLCVVCVDRERRLMNFGNKNTTRLWCFGTSNKRDTICYD